MNHNTGLDFQHILITDDDSLNSSMDIMTQLQLTHRLPGGRRTYEELLRNPALQYASTEQSDRLCNQFVFQGQCLVLGDSGVGKTSLVRSLTGKPFDPRQPQTQGIDQSLVDQNWHNLDYKKDLLFGSFSKFFKEILVLFTFFGKGGNVIVQESTNLTSNLLGLLLSLLPLIVMLIVYFLFWKPKLEEAVAKFAIFHSFCFVLAEIVKTCGFYFKEYFRLVATTCNNVHDINHGLAIGAFLSIIPLYYFCGMFEDDFHVYHAYLFLATCVVLTSVAFFLVRSFCIEREGLYPGQLKLKNRHSVEIILFGRFVMAIFIGFICCCVSLLFVEINWIKSVLFIQFFGCFCHTLLRSLRLVFIIVKTLPGWSWPNKVLLIFVVICFCYTLHVTESIAPITYFVIMYSILLCDSLYNGCFSMTSTIATDGNHQNVFTAIFIEKIVLNNRMLKKALDEKFSSLKLKILDFAGDKEYRAYHHMFLRSQAIYVIVFNMAEFAGYSFTDINARIKRLHLWFESVCSHVPPRTPIFLVGTHRGEMDKICMKSLNRHLKKMLWDCYCDELVFNDVDKLIFFPIENSNGQNDTAIQILQKKIVMVAEEYRGTIGRDIPLSWIQIQDAIICLKENKKAKFCVTLEEFPTAFANFICTNWSLETLKYFHEQGLVIYLDKDPELSKWVLLKPEILVEIIIQLVTPSQQMMQERGFRRDWKLLHGKGLLTKSLLKRIISTVPENEEAMTAFLEEYDLICPLLNKKVQICSLSDDEEHQPSHFVPSSLPMSEGGSMSVWIDDTTDKKFYVFFKKFLPEPLFHRLLSRARKNSKLEFPNGTTVVFRDVGKFWMTPWQPYQLKLVKDERIIEVTFSFR